MTKAEIKEELQILKQVLEHHRSVNIKKCEESFDFYDGKHRAYADCVTRIDKLIDKCFG